MNALVRPWLIGLRSENTMSFQCTTMPPGIDAEVLRRAHEEERILITNDKDVGDKVYRERYPHSGIVLLRLDNERRQNKIAVLRRLLEKYADRLPDQFVVATAEQVRFAEGEG